MLELPVWDEECASALLLGLSNNLALLARAKGVANKR